MARMRELGFPKTNSFSLKEQLSRTTLRNIRLQGHTYIDLRKDGKREVFFCTICLAPCYSDSILFSHLKGNLHRERLAAAQATLLKPNPWPFDDGVLFFNDSSELNGSSPAWPCDQIPCFEANRNRENNLALVSYGENLSLNGDKLIPRDKTDFVKNLDSACYGDPLQEDIYVRNLIGDRVIPGVLCKDEICDLEVKYLGVAQVSARFCEKDGILNEFHRIWCEWLGRKDPDEEDTLMVLEHDFAVITFPYSYNLGRKGLVDDIKYLLPSSPYSESEDNSGTKNRKRKSFSDPEDISEAMSNQYDSSGEESQSSNGSARFLLKGYDDLLLHSRVLKSKTMRRELRRQQSVAAERMCDICGQKMLPGKDVAALLNRSTGKLVCSSRNLTGAFHVFHVSCLIHWILLCELEIYAKQLDAPDPAPAAKSKRRSKRKTGSKHNDSGKNDGLKATRMQIYSAFCPECQGTGIKIYGDELEKPTVALSEMFRYKIKASDAHRVWMKSPEVLPNCSTGFHFPSKSGDAYQENVAPLKLLHFYRANDLS